MPKQQGTINVARFQGLLLERRTALLGRINQDAVQELEDPEATEGPRDTKDAGDNSNYEYAEDERLGDAQRATDRVRIIDAALGRIADGSYGTCVDCGEPIGEARLSAVPEAERCTPCQELADRARGGAHHATL